MTRLFQLPEIQEFISSKGEFKRLIRLTKDTDSYYLEKRNISKEYDPIGPYDFDTWKHHLNEPMRSIYENLHKDLLYTDERQSFDEAIDTFEKINELLKNIGE